MPSRTSIDRTAQIVLNAKATDLVVEDGRVCGVVAEVDGEQVTYTANKGVLLACGGYASNPEMVALQRRYTGIDQTVPSCEPATNDGTGIQMAQALGAQTANMSFVQFFSFPEAQMGSIESLFPLMMGTEKMLVNLNGERFIDDGFGFFGGGNGDAVRPICDQPSGRYFFIGDAEAQEKVPDYADRVEAGVIVEGETPVELAEAAGEVVGNTDGACRRHGDNFAHIFYYGWLAGKTLAET